MPPSWARAMARGASVTVSMAAETMGVLSAIVRVSRVETSTWAGRTSDFWGTSRTSSKVRASGNLSSSIQPTPWHFLYFFPLPQGQGSLRPTFLPSRRNVCTSSVPPSASRG